MDWLSVYVKDPGKKLEERYLKNDLESFQAMVGGHIETVTLTNGIVVICDEEGRLKGRPHSAYLDGIDFCGRIILAGSEEDEFSDCPLSMAEILKRYPLLGSESGEQEKDPESWEGLLHYAGPDISQEYLDDMEDLDI